MSKLIVEMEIPTVCDECPMMYDGIVCAATGTEVYPNNQARILKNGREFDPCENRLDDCPIVGVLPEEHGDLVDADAIYERAGQKKGEADPLALVRELWSAPVIIAAERKDDGN